jgi:hypothetical protein
MNIDTILEYVYTETIPFLAFLNIADINIVSIFMIIVVVTTANS